MKYISLAFALLICFACTKQFEESELYGVYVPVGYKNNYDTIVLLKNGQYNRKVYDKKNRLLLNMRGQWDLKNGKEIALHSFYLNTDDDLVKFPYLVNDTTGGTGDYLHITNDKTEFCTNYFENDKNCYCKVSGLK
ncbi:MAG: hypothetical protein V4543_13900 [Bacteroidota bacterium]